MTTSPGALSSCSAEKPRRKRVLDDKACEVCHDKSTGKHYGVYVCDGCSGFFKRSVRRSVPWVCRSNGNCVVDKASRTECRACRFKKCLMVNMNPEGVQTPRGSRMTHERKNASSDSDSNNSFSRNPSPNSEMSGSGFYEGREHSKYDKNDQDTGTKFAKIDISSQSKTKRSSPLQPDSPPLSMAVPAVGGELQHQIDSPVMVKLESQRHDPHGSDDDVNNIDNESEKETDPSRRPSNNSQVVAGQPNNVEPVGPGQHRLAQIVPFAARRPECYNQGVTGQMHPLIVPDSSFTPYGGPTSRFSATSSFPRYVAAVPHIRSTTSKPIPLSCPPSDSVYSMAVRLLSSAVKFAKNIPSFKLLPFRDQVILLEESWKDLFILDAAYWSFPLEVSYVVNPMELKKEVNSSLIASLRVLQELVARVQALEMDDAECAYLKTIVIFKPDIKGLKDSQQVEKLQDDTQVKFSEYVRAKRGDNPARFGRLLLTLLTFERVTQEVIEKLFFRTQSENVSVEYILHDMFKSN